MRLNFLLPVFTLLLTGCASVQPLPDHPGEYVIERHVSVFKSDDSLSAERDRMTEQATASAQKEYGDGDSPQSLHEEHTVLAERWR
ncbi:MAG: hypothetical protein IV105_19435 [Rhizobacter sp.]|nr:hypothetical protein [Rhizobacter sp.]